MENKSPRKRRTLWIVALVILIILVVFRLMLPSIVLRTVNQKLTEIDGYKGSAQDIDIFLLAGSYTIKELEIKKTGGEIPVPFFTAKAMELSVEWKALFKGDVVGEIEVDEGKLNFVKGPTKATTQTSIDKGWTQVANELIPLRINRFEISHGAIQYHDYNSSPKIDLVLNNVHILATNLTNADDKGTLLPATVNGSGTLYEGNVTFNMRLNPLNETPLFDMSAELTTMSLKNLNDFMKAYEKLDVQKGTLSLYAEASARENKIVGYAKPVIKDIDALKWKEEGTAQSNVQNDSVGRVAWIFRNHPKDRPATQVKFEGSMKQPYTGTWGVIGETLQNAFVKALIPCIENSVSPGSVSHKRSARSNSAVTSKEDDSKDDRKKDGFIKRIFKKKGDKNKKTGKDKKEGRNKKTSDKKQ